MVPSNNKNNTSNVLVVDDQAITRELLVRAISAQGFSVDSSASGEEALNLWLHKKHPMVITDCHMPIKDGYQLSKDIRNAEKVGNFSRTLIVAWTANSKEKEQEKCINAGMDDFLSKPINFNELKRLLANIKTSPNNLPIANDSTNPLNGAELDIDYAILSQVANDTDSQNKVINDLLSYIKHDYKSLKQHLETQNLTALEDIAHRLKGACKMVGANKLANALAAIESLNTVTSSSQSAHLLQKLNHAIVQLEQSVFCTA